MTSVEVFQLSIGAIRWWSSDELFKTRV